MSRWWWIRHGPTHARGFVGWTDLAADLSDHNRLNRLGLALPPDALVVSSDLVRAVATADSLAEDRVRLPHARDLREIHFGAWEGLTFAEISERDPQLARAFWSEPGDFAPPGGESWNALTGRVSAFVDALSATHPDRDIVAVAHLGVILSQYQRTGARSPVETLAQDIAPLSLSRFDRHADGWEVVALNRLL